MYLDNKYTRIYYALVAKWHDDNCIVIKQRVPSIKKKCSHCDTLAALSQYTRYHGDKCKKNITYTDL